jgi:hypothetical protein
MNFALADHGELLNTATLRGQIARFPRKRTVARKQREIVSSILSK